MELEGVQAAIEKEWHERGDMEDRVNPCNNRGVEHRLPNSDSTEGVDDACPVEALVACNEDVAYVLGGYM